MRFIRRIEIAGLNDDHDIALPIKSRHCVIVGPNGSGKSTALLIVSSALGRQWRRLAGLRFKELRLTFAGGSVASLTRQACENYGAHSGTSPRYVRMDRTLQDAGLDETFAEVDLKDADIARLYSDILRAPTVEVRNFQKWTKSSKGRRAAHKEILDFQAALNAAESPPVLYLPTYRRIELEIKSAIESVPDFYRTQFARALQGTDNEFIVELIKFGMEDVSSTIQQFERQTKDYARNQFNRMMTSYLKEMANAKALSVRDLRSKNIDSTTIDIVLSRIEEGLLSTDEKSEIATVILELSEGSHGNPPFNKKWLAHFFLRLLEVNKAIELRERPVRQLVEALQKYFTPAKSVRYDVENFHFGIYTSGGNELALSDLSSGEKQLVSLLTIMNFSESSKLNIFIDEPELSLSVPWQSDFLTDIAATPSCNQIFAVTHSPFIYDNHLQSEVVDFVECFE